MDSLYRRHPVGSLLVWATKSDGAPHRGSGQLAPGFFGSKNFCPRWS